MKDLLPSTLIAERYRIEEQVGYGWNSLYYRAWQTDAQRDVVIKILRSENTDDSESVDTFLFSARLMAQLEHQHIVPIYDIGSYHSRPFLTMRYLGNGSIQRLLDEQRQISISEKMRILGEASDALDFAHSRGAIHGDVKPQNLLLNDRDRLHIIDFEPITKIGRFDISKQARSSYPYMSLERLEERELTLAADVFSLACTAFTFLSGHLPFRDTPLAEQIALRQTTVPSLSHLVPDLPKAVEEVLRKSLQNDPFSRHQSASELMAALQSAVAGYAVPTSVFISYSRENPDVALQIVTDLKDNQIRVWFDQINIRPGTAWEKAIREGILGADKFVVILSPDAIESSFVQAEIDFAVKKGKRIIPIMHRKCDVPLSIGTLQYIDFGSLGYGRGFELLLRSILS